MQLKPVKKMDLTKKLNINSSSEVESKSTYSPDMRNWGKAMKEVYEEFKNGQIKYN